MSPDQLQQAFVCNVTSHQADAENFIKQLKAHRIPPEAQLGIYRRNFSGSIQKTLQQIYPACHRILGDDYFNTLCRDYYLSRPPIQHDLNVYGEFFSALLLSQCQNNHLLTGYEYLPDLATLEWHWHASYFSKNDSVFDFTRFSKLSDANYENVSFNLSHSISLHHSIYPVIEIWNSNRNNIESSQEYSIAEYGINFCIYRQQLSSNIASLSTELKTTLESILKKMDFNSLSQSDDFDINQTLPFIIQQGWVTGFSVKDKTC